MAVTLKKGEIWDVIAEYTGGSADVIINVPPGCMKSLLTNVLWQMWVWGEVDEATSRWLFWTYSSDLTIRDSRKARSLVTSEWYRWLYPHVQLSKDQNQKDRFDTTNAGVRLCLSVEGGGTGEGGQYIGIDDPHNAKQATYSDPVRQQTLDAWKATMTTRQRPPNSGARVGIMQRLHEQDWCGEMLRQGGWYHVCLPMEFDPDHPYKSIFDWRTDRGQLLWPAYMDAKRVARLKREMEDPDLIAGQLQQLPHVAGGSIFKREHFTLFQFDEKPPFYEFIIQSWDTAFTDKTQNDPSAMTIWGLYIDRKGEPRVRLLDCWRKHVQYWELRDLAIETWQKEYGAQNERSSMLGIPLIKPSHWNEDQLGGQLVGRAPDVALIEEKGSGIVFLQDLGNAGVPVESYNPGNMDKVGRAHAVAYLAKAGRVEIPAYEVRRGQMKVLDKFEPFMREVCGFPKVKHDDYTDTMTQALAMLRDLGMLQLKSPIIEAQLKDMPLLTGPRQNPYVV